MSLAGWAEILFISLLAFVIIGPKDLPKVLFMVGRFFQALRRLADEFKSEFEVMHEADQAAQEKSNKKTPPNLPR